ncbi:DUF819 family protein [Shewanella sp. 1_MG-2023]|uniref:DUF819 family protein n=1 Tax=unclassified Shewanella TaxID=196818 RepID=UPI001E62BBC1|nr:MULTISPECIES: DUF819 family protein [unclassified Shewanella]MCC4831559.1 DUF819 family protein [Shewanella sp. 10N.7]MDO6612215.1 DUF819 family protein [Shewanella sp. 7_MG-2023]MDO6772069.1 DUF819 family protein [Shewanella sp. 2_MG-2023]MDO6795809.1 DUF819 family protein [Shewanella sp. 1_MG-2023]
MINQDPVIFGLLTTIIGLVFYTSQSSHPVWKQVYRFVPVMVMCYVLPSLLNTFNIVDASQSELNTITSKFLMPACLTLLIISVDIKSMLLLGPKIIILFLLGSFGVIIGGPLTLLLFAKIAPETISWVGADAAWKGMATLAANWVGGTANQIAMKEIYQVEENLFAIMISVNVIYSAIWMSLLLICANNANFIDKKIGADASQFKKLIEVTDRGISNQQGLPTLKSYMLMFSVAFGVTGFAHFGADIIAPFFAENYPQTEKYSLTSTFFWIVIIVTTTSIVLSNTKIRELESVGASKVSTVMLYCLIANMGLQMDLSMVDDFPIYFAIGFVWLSIHVIVVVVTGLLMKAPVAYMALASQCCIGGAASSPVVAMAFHRSLAPVAILFSVFGYAWATYMAWICAELMRMTAQ